MVLLGTAYWGGLVDWMRTVQLAAGNISLPDLDLFHVTDDPAEAIAVIRAFSSEDGTFTISPDGMENEIR